LSLLRITGAEQILRPPHPGLPYLRGETILAQTVSAGDLLIEDGLIAEPGAGAADATVDASGCSLIPGFVDCHTHLPFAGWRAGEYEQKIAGVPYQEISRDGGGIASSARALSSSSDEQVLAQSCALADEMLASGTTTFECKSGYGLSRETELRALRLAAQLSGRVAQSTTSTALLAHSVPSGFTADGWMDEVQAMLPEVLALGTVTALDIFVESVAFSNEHLRRMGALAAGASLELRCHVEQFGGYRSVPVALAARARSADHLSTLAPEDVAPLAASECGAVLLPAAEFLGAEHRAPGRALLDAGALVVLGTDANPGTAPVFSIPLVIGLAVRLYGVRTLEALAAATLNGAWVLGLEHDRGSIEAGKRADLLLLDCPIDQVPYRLGRNPVLATFVAGEPAYVREDARERFEGVVHVAAPARP
jgi:imidazolonepropionase